MHQGGKEGVIKFLKGSCPLKFPGIKIIPITEAGIKNRTLLNVSNQLFPVYCTYIFRIPVLCVHYFCILAF